MTNSEQQDPAGVPYLFLPVTESEADQIAVMQDFMEKHSNSFPAMTVKAMLHYTALQLRNIMDIWQNDTIRQINEKDPSQTMTEEQKGQILNMQYSLFMAFLLANKERLSHSHDILHSTTQLLLQLYPLSDEGAK